MVISGGTGTLLGPIVGAAIVVIMKNVASAYIERWNLVLGAIFVAHHRLHAGRPGAGLACGCGAGPGARTPRAQAAPALARGAAMSALAVTGLRQVVRRPARHRATSTSTSSRASGG